MVKNDLNISEQLDHIAYMFNVRTNGKAYENFIVNAIYARVNNPNLVPVTQQYVKDIKDHRKYYLIDLYFPQLNYGIEIDERHHLKQQEKDDLRSEEINNAIQCEVTHIPIFNSDNNKRSYLEICKDIENVVQIIKRKIKYKGGNLKWETNEDKKSAVINSGFFTVEDDVSYKGITEIYNICGGKRGKYKGKADRLGRGYYKLNEKYKLWVPKIAVMINGQKSLYQNGYRNYLSDDFETITEEAEKPWPDICKDSEFLRVVFMQMKDRFGKRCVKFVGVYEMNKKTTLKSKDNKRYYKRIAKSVSFSDLKDRSKIAGNEHG